MHEGVIVRDGRRKGLARALGWRQSVCRALEFKQDRFGTQQERVGAETDGSAHRLLVTL
ncbi:MAG: hypothetical protein ACK4IT_02695 [Thioalkalivibrionaceae bacterium]